MLTIYISFVLQTFNTVQLCFVFPTAPIWYWTLNPFQTKFLHRCSELVHCILLWQRFLTKVGFVSIYLAPLLSFYQSLYIVNRVLFQYIWPPFFSFTNIFGVSFLFSGHLDSHHCSKLECQSSHYIFAIVHCSTFIYFSHHHCEIN